METNVSVKTITEVNKADGTFIISCFSDMNEDGTTTPVVFKSQVLDKQMEIDNIEGKEGELMLSNYGDKVGNINKNGELILEVENDKINRYHKEDEDLLYEQITGDDNNYGEQYESESYS
jgi:hypothetical protein